ncbi:helix-turn-helix domain-containing protein [Streptomyces sp. NPDC020731]|uniref:helix-turn-helix domain-containing protein n=1 Tax=Streptomyces sp. NPDC020731 TaxID=3365085 RepID=UPI0037881432
MVSHVEQAIAARIAAVRARRDQQAADRAALAEQRTHGLRARHAAKLSRGEQTASGLGQPRAREGRTDAEGVDSSDTPPKSNSAVTKSNDRPEAAPMSSRPVNEGAVIVPRTLAPTVFNAVVLYLGDRVRTGGGALTPDARALLRDLHRAAVIDHSSDNGTVPPATATVAPVTEVSVSEAAALLGCTAGYVRRLARYGTLTARRIGTRTWAIDRASLDTFRHGGQATP